MIKSITMFKNVVIYNRNHDREYFNKQGVIVIEKTNNKLEIVDLESGSDISNCDYLEVRIHSKRPKKKVLFENSLGEDLDIMQRNIDNMKKKEK